MNRVFQSRDLASQWRSALHSRGEESNAGTPVEKHQGYWFLHIPLLVFVICRGRLTVLREDIKETLLFWCATSCVSQLDFGDFTWALPGSSQGLCWISGSELTMVQSHLTKGKKGILPGAKSKMFTQSLCWNWLAWWSFYNWLLYKAI